MYLSFVSTFMYILNNNFCSQEHALYGTSILCFTSCTQDISNPALVDDPSKDPQYQEASIDSLRSQKDEVCHTKWTTKQISLRDL